MKRIYLDYAASTPARKSVVSAMKPYFRNIYANPSGTHTDALRARDAVNEARANVARSLSVKENEVVFTSGGTEANNLALVGVVRGAREAGIENPEVLISESEHVSVGSCKDVLRLLGATVKTIPVEQDGHISAEEVVKQVTEQTVLVSVSYVNNEFGTIAPIRKITQTIDTYRKSKKSHYPYVHTDASQAPLYLSCRVDGLGVELMTLDGQKCYGPKGVGALVVRAGTTLLPIFCGAGQEGGRRPGTENVPLIVGFSVALHRAQDAYKERAEKVMNVRDHLRSLVEESEHPAEIYGPSERRIANNLYVHIPGADAEYISAYLDARGVSVSTQSACTYLKEGRSSPALRAIGKEDARGIRFSLGEETTKKDVATAWALVSEALPSAKQMRKV